MTEIIVCAKQVLDTTQIRVDRETRRLMFGGVAAKISDYDKNAIEEAVRIKEKQGGRVTVIMASAGDVSKTLREALAMGADRGVMLRDRLLDGSDTLAVSSVLARIIKKLGPYDLIICGESSEDEGSAQIGPSLAEWLSIPHIAYVRHLKIEGPRLVAERKLERLVQTIECDMPLLVTVLREINEPRVPTTLNILRVPQDHVLTWTLADVGLPSPGFFEQPSAVLAKAVDAVVPSRKSTRLEGPPEEVAVELARIFLEVRGTSQKGT